MIFIFLGHKDLFAFFIWFNLTTDVLDGWIARRFNQITEIGSRIDALADSGTYILALTGIIVFKLEEFMQYPVSFFIFIGLFILARLVSLIKFRRSYSYHTYITKIAGYVQGIFFIVLFVIDFYPWFYYIMIFSGIVAFTEVIIISLVLSKPESDIKGLYWVLKNRMEKKKI
jgi:CDP-diacylglycerol--glycerol-3-phosphate 3-phosphatidyltransferase